MEALIGAIGHADRAAPLRDHCRGLLLPVARKSVEPLAAATAPGRVSAQHQSLPHFAGQAGWSDEAVPARGRDLVLPAVERSGPIRAAKAAGVAPGVVLGAGDRPLGAQGLGRAKAWGAGGRPRPCAAARITGQDHRPGSAKALAESLEASAWTTVTWREGSNAPPRLPPSRDALQRGLGLPDLRTAEDSPLRTACRRRAQGAFRSRGLPTQRRRRSGPNGTARPRSPLCGGALRSASQGPLLRCPGCQRPETEEKPIKPLGTQ